MSEEVNFDHMFNKTTWKGNGKADLKGKGKADLNKPERRPKVCLLTQLLISH